VTTGPVGRAAYGVGKGVDEDGLGVAAGVTVGPGPFGEVLGVEFGASVGVAVGLDPVPAVLGVSTGVSVGVAGRASGEVGTSLATLVALGVGDGEEPAGGLGTGLLDAAVYGLGVSGLGETTAGDAVTEDGERGEGGGGGGGGLLLRDPVTPVPASSGVAAGVPAVVAAGVVAGEGEA